MVFEVERYITYEYTSCFMLNNNATCQLESNPIQNHWHVSWVVLTFNRRLETIAKRERQWQPRDLLTLDLSLKENTSHIASQREIQSKRVNETSLSIVIITHLSHTFTLPLISYLKASTKNDDFKKNFNLFHFILFCNSWLHSSTLLIIIIDSIHFNSIQYILNYKLKLKIMYKTLFYKIRNFQSIQGTNHHPIRIPRLRKNNPPTKLVE